MKSLRRHYDFSLESSVLSHPSQGAGLCCLLTMLRERSAMLVDDGSDKGLAVAQWSLSWPYFRGLTKAIFHRTRKILDPQQEP